MNKRRTPLRFPWMTGGSIEWRTFNPSAMPKICDGTINASLLKPNVATYKLLIVDSPVMILDVCCRVSVIHPRAN